MGMIMMLGLGRCVAMSIRSVGSVGGRNTGVRNFYVLLYRMSAAEKNVGRASAYQLWSSRHHFPRPLDFLGRSVEAVVQTKVEAL